MLIPNTDFVDLLLGQLNNDAFAVSRMELAYRRQSPIWESGEWIYVKDTEVCLKGLHKLFKKGEFNQFINIKQLILDGTLSLNDIDHEWARSKIVDCRHNLEMLYPDASLVGNIKI